MSYAYRMSTERLGFTDQGPLWGFGTTRAMRARRANEAEGARGSDADEFLTAVDSILGTATGRRFLRQQAIRPKT